MTRRGNPNMRPGAPSVNPSGRAKPRTDVAEPDEGIRLDGWINALTGMGMANRDARNSTTYAPECVDRTMALSLWVGDDLAAKVIELEPGEMLRQGFKVNVQCDELPHERPRPDKPDAAPFGADPEAEDDEAEVPEDDEALPTKPKIRKDVFPDREAEVPEAESEYLPDDPDAPVDVEAEAPGLDEDEAKEISDAVHDLWEEIDLEGALYDGLCYEGAYGGGAVLLGINDGQALDQPVDPERVISIDYATALEPHEIVPMYFYVDPSAKKFGQVCLYQLNPDTPGAADPKAPVKVTSTSPLIHESRVIAFPGIRVSRSRKTTAGYVGWGDGKFTRLWPVLRDFQQVWSAAAILMKDFSVAVMKIKNLAELIAHDKGSKFRARLEAQALAQSILKLKLVDADGEDYERKTTSVTGLDLMMAKFSDRFCVAAGYPKGLIFERESGGLGDGAAAEIRTWYDRLKSKQKRKLGAPLKFLATCSFKAVQKTAPKRWFIGFNPLWQPTEKETAEIRKIYTDIDVALVSSQIATPEEVRVGRYGGGEFDTELKLNTSPEYMESMEMERAAVEEEERQAGLEAMQAKAEAPVIAGAEGPPAGPPKAEKLDFDPDQPRAEDGKWSSGGGGLGRTKDETKRKARSEKVEKAVGETKARHIESVKHRREKELDDAVTEGRRIGRDRGFEAATKELGPDAPFEKITEREQAEAAKAGDEARQAKIKEFIAKNAEVTAEGKTLEGETREEHAMDFHLEDAIEEGRIKAELPKAVKEYQAALDAAAEELSTDDLDTASVAAMAAIRRSEEARGAFNYAFEERPEELEGYDDALYDLDSVSIEDMSVDLSGTVESVQGLASGEAIEFSYSDREGYSTETADLPTPPNYADDEGVWSEEAVAKYREHLDKIATDYRAALDAEQTALEAVQTRITPLAKLAEKHRRSILGAAEEAFQAIEGENIDDTAADLVNLPKGHPEYDDHIELATRRLEQIQTEFNIAPDDLPFNDEHVKDAVKSVKARIRELAKVTKRRPPKTTKKAKAAEPEGDEGDAE